jgi:hypothetical protein
VKVSDAEMAALNISGDAFHPEWNYTIAPRSMPASTRSSYFAALPKAKHRRARIHHKRFVIGHYRRRTSLCQHQKRLEIMLPAVLPGGGFQISISTASPR